MSQEMPQSFVLTKYAWIPWGLSMPPGPDPNRPDALIGWAKAERCHDLVAQFLASHPDVAARYRPDQRGEVKYLDVLTLAEAEGNVKAERLP